MLYWVTFHRDLVQDRVKRNAWGEKSRKPACLLWEDVHPPEHLGLLWQSRIWGWVRFNLKFATSWGSFTFFFKIFIATVHNFFFFAKSWCWKKKRFWQDNLFRNKYEKQICRIMSRLMRLERVLQCVLKAEECPASGLLEAGTSSIQDG